MIIAPTSYNEFHKKMRNDIISLHFSISVVSAIIIYVGSSSWMMLVLSLEPHFFLNSCAEPYRMLHDIMAFFMSNWFFCSVKKYITNLHILFMTKNNGKY